MRGLAFVCSKPQPDAEANLARRAASIAQVTSRGDAERFSTAWPRPSLEQRRASGPGYCGRIAGAHDADAEAAVAVQAGLATRPDSLPTVATIGVPVLAIAGGEDPGSDAG